MNAQAMNFPLLPASLSVLALLGTAAAALAIAIAIAVALATGRSVWARRLILSGLGLAAVYGLALGGFALSSDEVSLPRGAEKYFCEIDCHLAYAVTSAERGIALPGVAPQHGEFWRVRLRTRFDETTISARRGREVPLTPNPREVAIVDARGQRYPPVTVPVTDDGSVALGTPLRPGEGYVTTLFFDLPRDASTPRLLVSEGVPEALVLIDNEKSFLHRKTYFALAP